MRLLRPAAVAETAVAEFVVVTSVIKIEQEHEHVIDKVDRRQETAVAFKALYLLRLASLLRLRAVPRRPPAALPPLDGPQRQTLLTVNDVAPPSPEPCSRIVPMVAPCM